MMRRFIQISIVSILATFPLSAEVEFTKIQQIYQEEGFELYEVKSSISGRYASFRINSSSESHHAIYDFKTSQLLFVDMEEDDLFSSNSMNSYDLLWSAKAKNTFRIRTVEGSDMAYKNGKIRDDQVTLAKVSLSLDGMQLATSKQLAWMERGGKSGSIIFSICERGRSVNEDIPTTNFDLYVVPVQVSGKAKPFRVTKDAMRWETSAEGVGSQQLIYVGIGPMGTGDLFFKNGLNERAKLTQVTVTPHLNENWPTASPDSRWLAYCTINEVEDTVADLWLVDLKNIDKQPVRLVENIYVPGGTSSAEGQYQWISNGLGLIFIKYSPTQFNPFGYVNIRTRQVQIIDADIRFPTSFSVTANDKNILYIAAGSSQSEEKTSFKAYVAEIHH